MSLIIIPLNIADTGENILKEPLLQLVSMISFESRSIPRLYGSSGELFYIVPLSIEDWDDDPDCHLKSKEIIKIEDNQTVNEKGERDDNLFQRLKYCMDHCARQNALKEDGRSVTVMVPAFAVNEKKPSDNLDNLSERLEIFNQAIDNIKKFLNFSSSQVRIIPWIFYSGSISNLPDSVFTGPNSMGNPPYNPIVYGKISSGGAPRIWEFYGRARIFTDMLVLYALSADHKNYDNLFSSDTSKERNHCYRIHSSFFEYPYEKLLTEKILSQVAGEKGGMLPDINDHGKEYLSTEIKDNINSWVNTTAESIREIVLKDVIREDYFDLKPQENEQLNFNFKARKHFSGAVSLQRRVDILHTAFYNHLVRKNEAPFERVLNDSLIQASENIDEESLKIETSLQNALKGTHQVEGKSTGKIRTAYGRVILMAEKIAGAIESISNDKDIVQINTETPEKILEDAKEVRESWIKDEEKLLLDASRLPSRAGVILESCIVFTGSLILAWLFLGFLGIFKNYSQWHVILTSCYIALLAALFVFYLRKRQLLAYEAAWKRVGSTFLNQANEYLKRLVKIANHRMKLIKYKATFELAKKINHSKTRFKTEINGFKTIVDEYLYESDRLKKVRESEEMTRTSRYFATGCDVKDISVDESELYSKLVNKFVDTISLDRMPVRIPVKQFHQIIEEIVQNKLLEISNHGDIGTDDIPGMMSKSITDGMDSKKMTQLPHEIDSQSKPESYVMIGANLRKWFKIDMVLNNFHGKLTDLSDVRDNNFVSQNLPRDVAITFTKQKIWLKHIDEIPE